MKVKYTNLRKRRTKTIVLYSLYVIMGVAFGFGIDAFLNTGADMNTVVLEPQPIVAYAMESHEFTEEEVQEAAEEDNTVPVSDVLSSMQCGVAAVFTPGTKENDALIEYSNSIKYVEGFEEPKYIRCTGYCDYGYTKSGEYVREGIVAGKKEWLGDTCLVYRVAEDGSCGEFLGSYDFLDTGYGIKTKTSKGVEGSLRLGKSIDIWFPSEDEIWDWMSAYGDYVYIKIIDND